MAANSKKKKLNYDLTRGIFTQMCVGLCGRFANESFGSGFFLFYFETRSFSMGSIRKIYAFWKKAFENENDLQ